MTRGVRTTLAMFVVLGGLAAFVVYTNNAEQAEATPAPSTYLWELTSEQVARLQVVDNTRKTAVTLSRDEAGIWQVETSKVTSGEVLVPAQPADPGQADYGASLVSTIFLRRTLTETTALGEYGLLAPAYAIHVTQTDGAELSLEVGYKTPPEDGYYVHRPGEAHPQIVAATALDPLFAFIDNPPLPPTPVPAEGPTLEGTPGAETATAEP